MFFSDADYLIYLHWLREYAARYDVDVLAYCLMPNHVHLVLVPGGRDSMQSVLRYLHMRYAQRVNREGEWTGHVWQGRYYASVLDEPYFWSAMRYVERNPVRACITRRAEDYAWSSAGAHCGLRNDATLTKKANWLQLLRGVANWSAWLAEEDNPRMIDELRAHTAGGLPCGSPQFIASLDERAGRKCQAQDLGRALPKRGVRPLF